eukprot:4826945-Karenia_brevis.AAC.1
MLEFDVFGPPGEYNAFRMVPMSTVAYVPICSNYANAVGSGDAKVGGISTKAVGIVGTNRDICNRSHGNDSE